MDLQSFFLRPRLSTASSHSDLLRLCFSIALFCVVGCAGNKTLNESVAPRGHVVYWNTAAYKARVDGFRLSPQEAYSQLLKTPREGTLNRIVEERGIGDHHVIVGDSYVFGFAGRSKMAEIPLSGYYVNANDGSVTVLHGPGVISEDQQRAMWGKVLNTNWGKDFRIKEN